MSSDVTLGSMVGDPSAAQRKKKAAVKLYMGAFGQAARVFGQVELYYNKTGEPLRRAIYYRNICEDAYYFGQMCGAQTSFLELEARLYDLEKEDYRAKAYEDPLPYVTNLTHVCHLYLDKVYERDWFMRSPGAEDFSGIYSAMVPTAISTGLMVRSMVTDGFETEGISRFFKEPALGWNLSTVCAQWIRCQDNFMYNPISEMLWLTLLPVLVARAGMAPYPALSIGGCFSFNTFIHRASFEEKMVYLSGVLLRAGKRAKKKFIVSAERVDRWEQQLQSQGFRSKFSAGLLPWLTVRRRFRVVDVVRYLGCPRATAARLVANLVKCDIIGYDMPGTRNKIYRTSRLFEL
ncbi:MAG: hypothetical protein JKY34_05845 [Kordiimonadaceae bacterium]|nr:hypothetical protein [Kordiimonadaceae bacterium]